MGDEKKFITPEGDEMSDEKISSLQRVMKCLIKIFITPEENKMCNTNFHHSKR